MAREPVIEYFDMRAEIVGGETLHIKCTATGDDMYLSLQEMRALQAFLNECLGNAVEPSAPQEKFPGAARNAEEMKIYQAGYDHGFRDGEQTASENREAKP